MIMTFLKTFSFTAFLHKCLKLFHSTVALPQFFWS